jgi:hypothetical protein
MGLLNKSNLVENKSNTEGLRQQWQQKKKMLQGHVISRLIPPEFQFIF